MSQPFEHSPLRARHVQRLESVVDFIDRCLGEDLDLDRLAREATYSPFHFHRLFAALTGETAGELVRRRRLETAAGRLRHCPGEPIVEVAVHCGFGSGPAFARAFRRRFLMSPGEWRAAGAARIERRPHGMSAVRVVRRAPFDVVYQRERGDYSASTVPLWNRTLPWLDQLMLADQPLLSVGLDDPTITSAERCRLDACVEVPPGWTHADRSVLRRSLPGGLYAVLRYVGDSRELHLRWAELLQHWLPESAYTLAEGPFFARHLPGASSPLGALLDCELHMPVR